MVFSGFSVHDRARPKQSLPFKLTRLKRAFIRQKLYQINAVQALILILYFSLPY